VASVLLIGYGNPGRLDDGLGPALAEAIERQAPSGVTVESDYQLTVEDAAEAAKHDIVLFADADTAGPEPYSCRRIEPQTGRMSFSTHSVSPQAVLGLAKELFDGEPEAYLLGIRGYEFNEFGQGLSEKARANLDKAIEYVQRALRDGAFREVPGPGRDAAPRPTDNEDDPCKTENT
jgi:hydrogenase maturation protease